VSGIDDALAVPGFGAFEAPDAGFEDDISLCSATGERRGQKQNTSAANATTNKKQKTRYLSLLMTEKAPLAISHGLKHAQTHRDGIFLIPCAAVPPLNPKCLEHGSFLVIARASR